MNATNISANYAAFGGANALGTFGSSIGLFVMAFAMAIVIGCIMVALRNWENYKKMQGFLGWLIRTFGFFLYGVLTLVIFGIPIGIAWLSYGTVAANPMILAYLGGTIGGYFGLCGLGWVFKRIYHKIGQNMEKAAKLAAKRTASPPLLLKRDEHEKNIHDEDTHRVRVLP